MFFEYIYMQGDACAHLSGGGGEQRTIGQSRLFLAPPLLPPCTTLKSTQRLRARSLKPTKPPTRPGTTRRRLVIIGRHPNEAAARTACMPASETGGRMANLPARVGRMVVLSFLSFSPSTMATEYKRKPFHPDPPFALKPEQCPTSCHDLFSKLEGGMEPSGPMSQSVVMQQRGEPKSGTGFMFEWATDAAAHACVYLTQAYGLGSCWIEWDFKHRTLIFEPAIAAPGAAVCSCDNLNRVTITLINEEKHRLPVPPECGYSHRGGIAKPGEAVCIPPDGVAWSENQVELWNCVKSSNCVSVDDHLQMAVLRDPRSMAVSAYFHRLGHSPGDVRELSVDEFVLEMLPTMCKWLSVRYLLFSELLAAQSAIFWYDDAMEDPTGWHDTFYSLVGLSLPEDVVEQAANAAVSVGASFIFPTKGLDEHEGGSDAHEGRTFRDELNSTTLASVDHVLRVWLPAVVLDKLGVVL